MGPPLEILLYTHAMTGGGAERVWALLASGLSRRGHKVTLATDFDAAENHGFVDPAVRRVTLGPNHVSATLALANLINRQKPDVSLSALSLSNLKHVIAATLARRRGRAVLSYHGYASSEPQPLSLMSYAASAVLTRLSAATVCVSDGLHRHVVKNWGAEPGKTFRIYNPVDPGPLPPARTADELLARGPVIVSVGRLVSYKQFPLLVRAFARVKSSGARLVILGEGPERPLIEAEIARLGLAGRVTLAGYTPEPWKYYAAASCFALSSDFETFGLVVVEALANGLPVVATDCDGPREILDRGRHGALVPARNEDALARAMDAALENPGDPSLRVARAREYSLDRGLDAYEDLIDRIVHACEIGSVPARQVLAAE